MKRAPVLSAGLGLFALLVAGLALSVPVPARAADGYLGVHIQDLDEALAAALDLEDAVGVLVSEVVADSPAEQAGLQRGDLILRIGDREATDSRRFTRAVRRVDAGESVQVEVLRKGRPMTLDVTLAEVPDDERFGRLPGRIRTENGNTVWFDDDAVVERAPNVFFGTRGSGARLGVSAHALDEDLGRYFGAEEGALVLGIQDDSAAEDAGLRKGDVIVAVDDEPVTDTFDLHEAIADHEPGDTVAVKFLRDRKEQTLEVELGEDEALHMVRGLRGPHHAPRVLHLETPHAPRFEFRDDLQEELEELRAQVERLQEQLDRIER